MNKRIKISLIGSGNIGGTLAHLISLNNLGDVVLLDVSGTISSGKALDISQSNVVENIDNKIIGTNNYENIVDSDAIIVTAGVARKPGMSRDDLISTNAKIIKSVGELIKKYVKDAFVIVVTNPLDAMVHLMKKTTGFDSNKVVGMAGVLDTSRFNFFLAKELNVSVEDIRSFVLGGHGDTMVPLINYCSVAGIPLEQVIEIGMISKEKVQEIIQRTRHGGSEIVKLLDKGSAYYAPATSVISMLKSYLFDKRRILPVAAHLNGEYGVKNLYIGVPAIIGKNGVEKIIEVHLKSDQKDMFDTSVKSVYDLVSKIDKI